MEPHFIEIVEVNECSGGDDNVNDVIDNNTDAFIGGGNVPEFDPMAAFLGGDDIDTNPNTYIIGGNEYVFDNVKFAFLQHLYDLESGKPSSIDPDAILTDMYKEVADIVSVKQAASDVICGFECFLNGSLLRLERADVIADITTLIPPKPEFCTGAELDVGAIHQYLANFNVAIVLKSGAKIEVKFEVPEYTELPQEAPLEIHESRPYAHIYASFKETENKGRKLLSELVYIDSVFHIVIENINKLREIIASHI